MSEIIKYTDVSTMVPIIDKIETDTKKDNTAIAITTGPIKSISMNNLRDAVNLLESQFSNNCCQSANSNCCQTCQSVTCQSTSCQSCQVCQTCQGCQTQCVTAPDCNCDCTSH